MRCGSGESQKEDGRVRPQRAANAGTGRDTKHQSPNRLVVMGWTGITGSLQPLADVNINPALCSFTCEEGDRQPSGELRALPRKRRSDLVVRKSR